MVDSVVLQLNSDQFKLREHNRFNEGKNQLGRGFSVNTRYCNEHTKSWKKKGLYCPMFNLPTRKKGNDEPQEVLESQFSITKLLLGTNVFDTDESDLESIYKKQFSFLDDFGVDTSIENLRKQVVRRVDFSKVIRLPDYLGEADEVIKILQLFNYKLQSEFRVREYSSGSEGIAVKFLNDTQGYAIYDKMGEIISEGFTKQELKFKEMYMQGKQRRNALKFELSLQRKDSLEAVVRRRLKIDKKKDFYLSDILNRDLARGILLDKFNSVFNNVSVGLITLSQMEENRLYAYLGASNLSQIKQEKLFYWVRMATTFGIAGTWERLKVKYKGGSITRCKKEIALALQELGQLSGNVPNLIEFLRTEHEKFEIIKPRSGL